MKFRLTYEGELRPTQRDPEGDQDNPLAQHKHCIRREFHKQLKQLWKTNKFLREHKVQGGFFPDSDARVPLAEAIANDNDYRKFEYRFVPLVLERFSLLCSLDILFLRRDMPGSALTAGDIDNRIKTLIDTLRPPMYENELSFEGAEPGPDENPFYCLLEDDKLISHFAVETDTLLVPPIPGDEFDHRRTKVIVTVELRPYDVTTFNQSFA